MAYCPCCESEMIKIARGLWYCMDCKEHFDKEELDDKFGDSVPCK